MSLLFYLLFLKKSEIHSKKNWRANKRYGVTRKRRTKGLKDIGNIFRKNLHLKGVG